MLVENSVFHEKVSWLWTMKRLSLLLVLGMTVGCAPETVTVRSAPQFDPQTIHVIAILPLQSLATPQRVYQSGQESSFQGGGMFEFSRSIEVNSPSASDRLPLKTMTVPKHVPNKISHMIYTKLKQRVGVQWISPEKVLELKDVNGEGREVENDFKRIGSRLSADAVIQGLVRIYRERESKYGGNPAAVGFDLQLIDTNTGATLWVGSYYEEQKPLTEDFQGFFERGGIFVTAEELAQSGVTRLMKQFPVGVTPSAE